MYKELKAWISGMNNLKDNPLSALALMRVYDTLKHQEALGNITQKQRVELHKYAMKVMDLEV